MTALSPTAPLRALGRASLHGLQALGGTALFLLEGIAQIFSGSKILPRTLQQIYVIGSKSLFLILLIGIFCGMVLGLQGYYTLVQFGSVAMLGSAVSLTLIRELGPVLTAIMLTGRAGSSMAAEIGVMRITDQIDALDVMDINSMGYLVSPRLLASLISFPLLTAIFDVIGILGGYLTACSCWASTRAPTSTAWPFPSRLQTSAAVLSSLWSSACWWPPSAAARATMPTGGATAWGRKP